MQRIMEDEEVHGDDGTSPPGWWLVPWCDDAEAEGCTVVYPGSRGDCDPDAIAVCDLGNCTWM